MFAHVTNSAFLSPGSQGIVIAVAIFAVVVAGLLVVHTIQLTRISREVFLARIVPELRRLNHQSADSKDWKPRKSTLSDEAEASVQDDLDERETIELISRFDICERRSTSFSIAE